MDEEKNSIEELIDLYRRRQGQLPFARGPSNQFLSAAEASTIPCFVEGCTAENHVPFADLHVVALNDTE